MNVVSIIKRKRDGEQLSEADVRDLVSAYVDGDVADYQMSAFLMAAFLQGMSDTETAALLDAMLHSGDVLDWSDLPGSRIDKHSTGGVGDKVSLILAPMAAACGLQVPMISGRGLGHTGGTLDKLESIPGFRTDLTVDRMRRQLKEIGVAMMGQTEEIAPADRKIYALRDVTATVEFIPFIAASIMSKKLAAGLDGLVLDVKTGEGAFMKDEAQARLLAETLVRAGRTYGCPTTALLTSMDTPLGRAVGNFPEVEESIQCLRGEGHHDLMQVTVALVAEMLVLGGRADSLEAAEAMAERSIEDGSALERFRLLVAAQGGDPGVIDHPDATRGVRLEIPVPKDARGYVAALPAREIGELGVQMGAGRSRKEDPVDPLAGIWLNKTVGDPVEPGSVLATLYGSDVDRLQAAAPVLRSLYRFGDAAPPQRAMVIDRFDGVTWNDFGSG